MAIVSATSRQIPCPACGTRAEWSPANPYRPFCSERCRMVDLGNWASERYSVPAPLNADDLDQLIDELPQ
ncbi:DNA gyrase inhibitor YacG [Chitinimonas lacunae]|uniref:DNA gyrase inhibitor YacG n=1 Tax=Chitinimonas lacunae TaxID=1963018 RepID=A0ABV8MRQ7_9NEIS